MSAQIGIILLFGLFLWVFIDIRRIRKSEAFSVDKARGWDKNAGVLRQSRIFCFGTSIFFYVTAIHEWRHASEPPFQSHSLVFNFLFEQLYYLFGPKGIAYFWGLVATVLLLAVLFKKEGYGPTFPTLYK